jgi:dihydroorotase
MRQLLLKNCNIVDPVLQKEHTGDILIKDGIIDVVAKDIKAEGNMEIIDLEGKTVAPGFIDMHVHLREPGFEDKETIATGTRAAAAGGFTSVVAMPNTKPAVDNEATVEFIKSKAQKDGVIEVLPCATITKGRKGEEISEYGILKSAGAVALSDDGDAVSNPEVLRRAMEYAKIFDLPILSHCEDKYLSDGGAIHEGYYSTILGLKGIPSIAEDIAVARDIAIAEYIGARLHIQHVSTLKAVELIRRAKQKGIKVTAEAAPHHFTLTDADVVGYNTFTKVNPPLRPQEHVDAIIAGIKDGTIDAIASDHAPHTSEDKDVEYDYAAFGISGIETSVALSLDCLFHKNKMPVMKIIEMFTIKPASILGLEYKGITGGSTANLTILDLDKVKRVNIDEFISKGKNSPFGGKELKGWPVMTIYKGQIVYKM